MEFESGSTRRHFWRNRLCEGLWTSYKAEYGVQTVLQQVTTPSRKCLIYLSDFNTLQRTGDADLLF